MLARIGGSERLHLDRVRSANETTWRYLVAELDGEVVARGCLLTGQPADWPEISPLPKMIDIAVRADMRGRGVGSAFIRKLELLAAERGFAELWLSADPQENARAMALYERLGYESCPPEPLWRTWQFKDSSGAVHHGQGWDVTM